MNAFCRVADFDYDLPEELIAQQPPAERGQSRMMLLDRTTGAFRDRSFADFLHCFEPGDLLVLNDSRVIPARLFARRTLRREREKPTGRIEVMLTEAGGGESLAGAGAAGAQNRHRRAAGVSRADGEIAA